MVGFFVVFVVCPFCSVDGWSWMGVGMVVLAGNLMVVWVSSMGGVVGVSSIGGFDCLVGCDIRPYISLIGFQECFIFFLCLFKGGTVVFEPCGLLTMGNPTTNP